MIFLSAQLFFQSDWVTFVFIAIFLLLAISRIRYHNRLLELFSISFSKKYFLTYGKKDKSMVINGFNTLMFIIQVLMLSLLVISFVVLYKEEYEINNHLFFYLQVVFFISLFFLIKYILGLFLAFLFRLNQEHQLFTFIKVSYLFCFLLFLFPLFLLLFFSKIDYYLTFRLTIIVLSILLIIRYIFIFKYNKNVFSGNWYYFFLYLCALEAAPLLLILKLTI